MVVAEKVPVERTQAYSHRQLGGRSSLGPVVAPWLREVSIDDLAARLLDDVELLERESARVRDLVETRDWERAVDALKDLIVTGSAAELELKALVRRVM